MARQPTFFIPHGGGPCFFMDDPSNTWRGMAKFLRSLPGRLVTRPKAILVVSGHWETHGFGLTGATAPKLLYDYYGFPPLTYQITYPAPGAPGVAEQARKLLSSAGIAAALDHDRGLDHGVFIPLKVAFPDADIPVVEMSVDRGLNPALHLAAGRALAPLRDQNVLIVGSGMSFHNMRGYRGPRFTKPSEDFDGWLTESVTMVGDARATRLERWEEAPSARLSHPEAEHLLPLMVAAGAADEPGERIYSEHVMKTALSGFRFD